MDFEEFMCCIDYTMCVYLYSSSYRSVVGIILSSYLFFLSKMILDRMREEWSVALVMWPSCTFNNVFLTCEVF